MSLSAALVPAYARARPLTDSLRVLVLMSRDCLPLILLCLPGAILTASGCEQEVEPGQVCEARLLVRFPADNPLSQGDTAKLLVESRGAAVHQQELDLGSAPFEGGEVVVRDLASGTEPIVLPGDSLRVVLHAGQSISGSLAVHGVGRTNGFACQGEDRTATPLYIGPANAFARTPTAPVARMGAKAAAAGDEMVVIVGGETKSAAPVTPSAVWYDHTTGTFCAPGEACWQGGAAPPARVEHTVTELADGRVLIVGGRTPGTNVALSDIWVFDPQTRMFFELGVSLSQARRDHVAVLVPQAAVPREKRGLLWVSGGRGGDGTAPVYDTALWIDAAAATIVTVASKLRVPRYQAAAVAVAGVVLLSGGIDGAGSRLESVESFDLTNESFSEGVHDYCPGQVVLGMCARRARHTMTVLDDGNVLVFGGEASTHTGAVMGYPVAEVWITQDQRFLPASELAHTGTGAWVPRVGHGATRIPCLTTPCPILISGGEDPDSGADRSAALFRTATAGVSGDSHYRGTLSDGLDNYRRAWHTATGLADGTILVVGGREPGLFGELVAFAEGFSFCSDQDVAGIACPAF